MIAAKRTLAARSCFKGIRVLVSLNVLCLIACGNGCRSSGGGSELTSASPSQFSVRDPSVLVVDLAAIRRPDLVVGIVELSHLPVRPHGGIPIGVVQPGEHAIGGLNDQLVRLGVHLQDFVCVSIEGHPLRPFLTRSLVAAAAMRDDDMRRKE